MWEQDCLKIVFITNKGVIYYKVMSFDLKNVRASYQRMMNKVFKNQVERNLKMYMDGMLIKFKSLDNHLAI